MADPRIKLILKKTRPIQLLFVVVAVVCLLVFLVFNFSLNDRAGAFEVRHAAQQVEIPVTREGLTDISIDASNVQLEIGMVSSLTKPQVILAGKGYDSQTAKVDIDGTTCTVALEGNNSNAENLTMQVLLPQSDLTTVQINGEALDLHVEDLRTSCLTATVHSGGYAYFADVKADSMNIASNTTPIRFHDNQVAALTLIGGDASVTMLENHFERVDVETREGDIFSYDRRFEGQWDLQSARGDINVLTKNLPYNVTMQAFGDSVDIGYDKRYWKDAKMADVNGVVVATVGNNPDKILYAFTDGVVSIGQRERYSDLDPYAGDYPFTDTNPYLIERSTITK